LATTYARATIMMLSVPSSKVRVLCCWMLCALLMLAAGCDDGATWAPTITLQVHNASSRRISIGHEIRIAGHPGQWSAYGFWDDESTTEPCEGLGFVLPAMSKDHRLEPNESGTLRWTAFVIPLYGIGNSGPSGWCDGIVRIPPGDHDLAICPDSVLSGPDERGLYCYVHVACQTVRVSVNRPASLYRVTFTDEDVISYCD